MNTVKKMLLSVGVTADVLSIALLQSGATATTPVDPDLAPEPPSTSQVAAQPAAIETPPTQTATIAPEPQPVAEWSQPKSVPSTPAIESVQPTEATTSKEPTSDVAASVEPSVKSNVESSIKSKVEPDVKPIVADPVSASIIKPEVKVKPEVKPEESIAPQAKPEWSPSKTVQPDVKPAPTTLQLEPEKTRIPADGRSTVTIRGTLSTEKGQPAADSIVTLTTSAGEFMSADADRDLPGFQVTTVQGNFEATLRAGLEATTVSVSAQSETSSAQTNVIFETELRPTIAAGSVNFRIGRKGLNFRSNLRDFLPPDGTRGTEVNFNSNAFATGTIGEWKFTGAYNSDRPLNKTCDDQVRLFQGAQACEQNYPVYGDSSENVFLTPSTDHVFFKLERTSPIAFAGIDYGMWGDYRTDEFNTKAQEFTAIARPLHGAKINYSIGSAQLTGFYANNLETFQRDTLPPDGTSGYYFLSRRLVIPGSEEVYLEEEEFNRPGTVVQRKRLNRDLDYEVNYDRGTLIFREPVLRTAIGPNGEIIIRRIVTTYQYDSPGAEGTAWGGRFRYHFARDPQKESWVGATYVKQQQGARTFQLTGADAYWTIAPSVYALAEYANSRSDNPFLGELNGSAYRAEIVGKVGGLDAKVYYRSAETGFTNPETVSFVPGQTRFGSQASIQVSDTTRFRFNYDRETNRGIAPAVLTSAIDLFSPRTEPIPGTRQNNSLTTFSAGMVQAMGAGSMSVDWFHRNRTDRMTPDNSGSSDQLRSRLSVPVAKDFDFIALNETTVSRETDAYNPDRTLVGFNWQFLPGVNLQLAQQFFHRGEFEGKALTNLSLNSEYRIGPDTRLTGRYALLGGANGLTNLGAIGLNQKLKLLPGLRMDLNYEHVFSHAGKTTAAGPLFIQPFASGQGASALALTSGDSYSVGLEYDGSDRFNASARFEQRNSSFGTNQVITAGATGKLSPALTTLVRYQQASSATPLISGLGDTAHLKVGLAYRDPGSDVFNALLKYEYRQNPHTIPESILTNTTTRMEDHVLSMEGIYAPSWQWELYGKFGVRNSTIADTANHRSQALLGQTRLTYRPASSWDIVGEARWISQPTEGDSESGFAIETGYYVTPTLRLAAGYSFGRAHDRDLDDRSASGPYLGVSLKVNELFLRKG